MNFNVADNFFPVWKEDTCRGGAIFRRTYQNGRLTTTGDVGFLLKKNLFILIDKCEFYGKPLSNSFNDFRRPFLAALFLYQSMPAVVSTADHWRLPISDRVYVTFT